MLCLSARDKKTVKMMKILQSDEVTIAGQKLIDAITHDMQVRAELEKEGKLFEGYHPQMRAIHESNALLLEDFLNHYGWPYPSKYSKEIHEAAWMIAIHAISRPTLMKRVLNILEQALQSGQPVANEYAKFFDRIALYEGRPQMYGTQFFPSPQGWIAKDLYAPQHVDERRAQLGLSNLVEYKKEIGVIAGGFMDATALQQFDDQWISFLKEVGWR